MRTPFTSIMLEKLQEIGLSKGEIAIYEALIALGETTKTALAKKSGVSPSNIYDITNRLLEKGLISRVKKNNIAHFSAANPDRLTQYLENKKQQIDEQEKILQSILPALKDQFENGSEPTKVEQFEGWRGLQTVFDDMLDECERGDKNYIFGATVGENETQTDVVVLKNSRRRESQGIQTQIVFDEAVKKRLNRISYFTESPFYETRFFQNGTPTEIMLYKNKVCIIMLEKNPLIIRITSEQAFLSFKMYFDIIWNQAKA